MDRVEALTLLKDVLAETVRADGPDLNVRQSAILLRVALEPGPHTVRGLAEALGLGKPAVSRALDALEELGADYVIVHVDLAAGEQKRLEYLELNPNGKVPTLVGVHRGLDTVLEL